MRLSHYLTEAEQLERWHDYVNDIRMLKAAVKVLQKIEDGGYKAYIVGGSVRDIVMGIEPKDIDITTNCPITKLEKIFGKIYDIGQSKEFGIVVIREGGYTFEIAQFRRESYQKIKGVRKILNNRH